MLRRTAVSIGFIAAAALSPSAAPKKNAARAPKTAPKEVHAAKRGVLSAAALEEELKTNTPYWYDNRIHPFGNAGFGGGVAFCVAAAAARGKRPHQSGARGMYMGADKLVGAATPRAASSVAVAPVRAVRAEHA